MPYDNDAWWQPQKWTQCGMVQQKTIRKCATCGATEQGRAAYGKHYCFECWDTYRTEQDSRRWHDHQPPEQEERQSTATTAAAPVGESGGGGSHLSTAATMEQSSPVVTHASDAPIEAGDNNDQAHTEDGDNPEAGSIKSKAKPRRPPARLWCQLLLHKQHQGFDLIPMLIGRGGCNMKDIHLATKAKVRNPP